MENSKPTENIHLWLFDKLNITHEQKVEIVKAMEQERVDIHRIRIAKKEVMTELLETLLITS
jgi:Spy/CpxP family protein refolding chaperone